MGEATGFPKSDHFDGRRFFNPGRGAISKSFRDFMKWRFQGNRKPWPEWVRNTAVPAPRKETHADEIVLTFINHITFLIQTNGLNVLTDPVYSERVSPIQSMGPKRVRPPGLAFDKLPKIDLVMVSHNHYDHMDIATLRALAGRHQATFVTPLGNGQVIRGCGANRVVEQDWWQTTELPNGNRVHIVPAQHWSGRGLYDRNMALWCGFLLETPAKKIYFAADTGYGAHFGSIKSRFGTVDLALLPIGAYEPRWFMKEQHMNPEDAVFAHLDLGARMSVGTHFGCWRLTDEAIDQPLFDLRNAKLKHQVDNFVTLEVGETRAF